MRRTVLVLFLLELLALAAPVPELPRVSVPLPGGMADSEGKVGFVLGGDGGIDALDLATGKVLWTSKATQKVVAVDGNRVLALAGTGNTLKVVSLAGTDGKQLASSDAVTFPDWVAVRLGVVTMDAGKSFSVMGRLEKGNLYLRWRASASYWGGARPTPEIEAAARKNAEGVARINLEDGKVEAVGGDRWPATGKVSAQVEKVAARPMPGGEKSVTVVGDLAVAVDSDDRKTVLRRWTLKDAQALAPVTLLEGAPRRVELAAESGRVLITWLPTPFATPPAVEPWYVFDLATGKQVGKLELPPTTREATVAGTRAFFVVNTPGSSARPFSNPRLLRAVDIATGKTLWDHWLEAERRSPPPR